MELLLDTNYRRYTSFDPLEDEVVDPIARNFLEYTNIKQFFPYLSLVQFRYESPLPIIPLKYSKPSNGELFAAIKL